MNPIVSVVLPTYNGSRFIDRSIESVVTQSFTNWELIVVDDGSSDDTPSKIASWVERDPRIRAVTLRPNRKLPAALNEGFRHARGEFFTWTSDDNYYRPEALAYMVAFLDINPTIHVVYTDYSRIDEEDRLIGSVQVQSPEELVNGNAIGPSFLYRRIVQSVVGAYSEDLFLAEDLDFWLRTSEFFRPIPLHHDLYFYRLHPRSLTSKYSAERARQVADITLARYVPYIQWVAPSAKAAACLRLARNALYRGEWFNMMKCAKWALYLAPLFAVKQSIRSLWYHGL